MNSSCFLGDQSEALPIDEKKKNVAALNNERFAKIQNLNKILKSASA